MAPSLPNKEIQNCISKLKRNLIMKKKAQITSRKIIHVCTLQWETAYTWTTQQERIIHYERDSSDT